MDHKFTEEIGAWLATPEKDRDWEKGAIYVLKLSGNRILFNNIMRCIDRRHDVIEYQIKKYYNFRVKDLTHEQVEEMAQQVEQIVKSDISLSIEADENRPKGKRPDHDSLPDAVKAFYFENLDILRRMRELHLKLRSLSLGNVRCPDSERYPFLKEIIKLDKKMHENWKAYDSFSVASPVTQVNDVEPDEDEPEAPQAEPTEPDPEQNVEISASDVENPDQKIEKPADDQKKKEPKKKTGAKSKKA